VLYLRRFLVASVLLAILAGGLAVTGRSRWGVASQGLCGVRDLERGPGRGAPLRLGFRARPVLRRPGAPRPRPRRDAPSHPCRSRLSSSGTRGFPQVQMVRQAASRGLARGMGSNGPGRDARACPVLFRRPAVAPAQETRGGHGNLGSPGTRSARDWRYDFASTVGCRTSGRAFSIGSGPSRRASSRCAILVGIRSRSVGAARGALGHDPRHP